MEKNSCSVGERKRKTGVSSIFSPLLAMGDSLTSISLRKSSITAPLCGKESIGNHGINESVSLSYHENEAASESNVQRKISFGFDSNSMYMSIIVARRSKILELDEYVQSGTLKKSRAISLPMFISSGAQNVVSFAQIEYKSAPKLRYTNDGCMLGNIEDPEDKARTTVAKECHRRISYPLPWIPPRYWESALAPYKPYSRQFPQDHLSSACEDHDTESSSQPSSSPTHQHSSRETKKTRKTTQVSNLVYSLIASKRDVKKVKLVGIRHSLKKRFFGNRRNAICEELESQVLKDERKSLAMSHRSGKRASVISCTCWFHS